TRKTTPRVSIKAISSDMPCWRRLKIKRAVRKDALCAAIHPRKPCRKILPCPTGRGWCASRNARLTIEMRFMEFWMKGWCATLGSRPMGKRSEEHTSELQSRSELVCRLLLDKKDQGWLRYGVTMNMT